MDARVAADVPETDDDPVARAGRGDRAGFARLIVRHQGRLAAVAARIVGDPATAADVVQETFLRAWVRAPSWVSVEQGGKARYTTWLARIAVNLAIDRRRRPGLARLDSAAEPVDPAPDAEAALLTREQDAVLADAVANLPDRQRAAIALTYDQGLSNADGALALGIGVGAFELLLVRARRSLRGRMKDLGDG